MVAAGIAIAVSGATGTGKTTMLNVLATAIPVHERVITVEDLAELRFSALTSSARGPATQRGGPGEVPLRELVRNALRMPRPRSSSARSAAPRCSTCCRPPTPATAVS